jgi:hypothetical protein
MPLPGTLTFKYPTVAAIAEFLAREMLSQPAAPPLGDVPASATDADVDDLSEDDLATLLASKLAQIQ